MKKLFDFRGVFFYTNWKNIRNISSLLLFFLLGSSEITDAQTPRNHFIFKQFIDEKGTLSNIVSCFLEDKDGFLWIGTSGGLKRFDGYNLVIFKHEKGNPNSLTHSVVQSLCEDNLGRIWVGTGEGIGYFDKKTNHFINLPEFNKSGYVCFNILCDNTGNIWFSIRGKGLFQYSEKTKKTKNFINDSNNKSSIDNNWIDRKGIILDPLKRGLWMVTDAGINFFDFSKKQFFNRGNNPKNISIFKLPNIKSIALDEANIISYDFDLQTLNYFNILKEQVIKELPLKNIFHNKQVEIRYIFADKQHNLWLSDWFDYCYYYDIKTQKAFPLVNDPSKPTTIAANSFWAVYEHKGGSIWLGTNDGISITNPVHNFYEIYDLALLYPKLKNENQLYSFLEDSADNTWWLSATPNSFVHYYPKTNQLEVFNIPFIRNQSIQALIDYQNNIYVVASESFLFFDKKKKKIIALPLPDSLIANNHIAHTMQKGDSIWFFGNNSYAYSYKISTQKWTYYPILTNSLMDISCSEVDNHGDIWIAIQTKGLAKFSKKKQAFELVNTANDLEFKKIWHYAIQKDTKGNFWIGSFYEVIEFDPITQKFHNSLDVNVIADMIVDKNDNIWTAAYNDISVFFPNRKKSVTETIPINKGNFNMNWRNSLYCLKNGQIISLIKGNVVKIFPSKLISSSTKDKVLISKITLVNDEILLHNDTSAVDLASSENGFSVYFSTLNPPDEQKYKYTYQLSNYNKSWVSLPNNNATFSNLDGGDYVFQVKGIDNNGYETPISRLKIHIDTVFYKSKWFLYGCVFLICSLFYAFMRFRAEERSKIYHLRMQSTRLEKDKTEIQYQNLINHLNPHFLFNSLTSLNSLIMTEPKEASKFLQKLSLIYRYILQNKDKDIVSLEQEVGFVKHYINLQKSRFEDGLQINISIEKEYLPCGIVPVTLQNLLENAIKHNTIEEDNPLIINVLIKDNYLLVRNNLQKKKFVETSNKQGLESLKSLYKYLTNKPLETVENDQYFTVKIPLL